jgi:flagellum-specific ATP synthase
LNSTESLTPALSAKQLQDLKKVHEELERINPFCIHGKVTQVVGLVIEGHGPRASVGELCDIYPNEGQPPILTEVVGFRKNRILLMPIGSLRGIGPGSKIVALHSKASVKVGTKMLGRIFDGLGAPLDRGALFEIDAEYPLYPEPINPLDRLRISEPLDVGIKSINGLLTCGKGQRMGIFSGSGVGKSLLLGMIARNTSADINVIGLIGERGREVREFIERDLGAEGLKRSVVVVATSDQPPLVRMRGALIATAIAEYFRDQGKDVLLMVDSVTRLAMAQREVGLAIGEPPTTKGYTPSVFTMLPQFFERVGITSPKGSITGLYTILVEGDDMNDPLPDAVRAIIDGHIVLSRDLAAQNHYPAIDVLQSISRLMIDIVSNEQLTLARRILEIMDTYKKSEDLIKIGAYVSGTSLKTDYAIKMVEKINNFLKQDLQGKVPLQDCLMQMKALLG